MRYFRLINDSWIELIEDPHQYTFTGLYVRSTKLSVDLYYRDGDCFSNYLLSRRSIYGIQSYELGDGFSTESHSFFSYYTANNFKRFKRLIKKLGIDD